MDANIDVNIRSCGRLDNEYYGRTKNSHFVTKLLEKGMNVKANSLARNNYNQIIYKSNIFEQALLHSTPEILRLLINNGADPNQIIYEDRTSLNDLSGKNGETTFGSLRKSTTFGHLLKECLRRNQKSPLRKIELLFEYGADPRQKEFALNGFFADKRSSFILTHGVYDLLVLLTSSEYRLKAITLFHRYGYDFPMMIKYIHIFLENKFDEWNNPDINMSMFMFFLKNEHDYMERIREALNMLKILNSTIRSLKNHIILNVIRPGIVKVPPHYPNLLLNLNDTNKEIKFAQLNTENKSSE